MRRNEILKKINEVFIDVLEEEVSIKEEYYYHDVDGWDSLTHIMLLDGLEKKFEIKFLSSEIDTWKKISDIVNSISSKI